MGAAYRGTHLLYIHTALKTQKTFIYLDTGGVMQGTIT